MADLRVCLGPLEVPHSLQATEALEIWALGYPTGPGCTVHTPAQPTLTRPHPGQETLPPQVTPTRLPPDQTTGPSWPQVTLPLPRKPPAQVIPAWPQYPPVEGDPTLTHNTSATVDPCPGTLSVPGDSHPTLLPPVQGDPQLDS